MQANPIFDESQIPLFFNVEELIKILGISRTTAYALVHTKGFPCGRIGSRILIQKDAFLDWVNRTFQSRAVCRSVASSEERRGA